MTSGDYSAADWILTDSPRTLFPTKLSRLVGVENGARTRELIEKSILPTEARIKLLPQTPVLALKPQLAFRKTLRLDPLAEAFIYGWVNDHRKYFKVEGRHDNRASFGFSFRDGRPVDLSLAYRAFKAKTTELKKTYRWMCRIDVQNYFNNIYHHFLCQWLSQRIDSAEEVKRFNYFGTSLASGDSIGFFPQGIMPTKVVGSAYLDQFTKHGSLRSAVVVRFMDDIVLADDNAGVVRDDFLRLQESFASKNLFFNAAKTEFIPAADFDLPSDKLDDKADRSLSASIGRAEDGRATVCG